MDSLDEEIGTPAFQVRATYESERGDLWAETFRFSLTQCPASVRGRPGPGDWD